MYRSTHREDLERCPRDNPRLTEDQWCPGRVCVGEGLVVGCKGETGDDVEGTSTEASAPFSGGNVALLGGGECSSGTRQSKSHECEDGVHDEDLYVLSVRETSEPLLRGWLSHGGPLTLFIPTA